MEYWPTTMEGCAFRNRNWKPLTVVILFNPMCLHRPLVRRFLVHLTTPAGNAGPSTKACETSVGSSPFWFIRLDGQIPFLSFSADTQQQRYLQDYGINVLYGETKGRLFTRDAFPGKVPTDNSMHSALD